MKVKVINEMKTPQTKTELRQILGFLSYFREHIANFAEIAKPLTDLTARHMSTRISWGIEQQAFDELRRLLYTHTFIHLSGRQTKQRTKHKS